MHRISPTYTDYVFSKYVRNKNICLSFLTLKYLSVYRKVLFLIAAGFLLSGCNTLKQNVVVSEPTEGERARVRVVIQDIDYRGVRAYPNSACVNDTLQGNGIVANVQMVLGFEKNLNNKKIGIPETAHSVDINFVSSEIYVAANEPITFRFHKPNTKIEAGIYSTWRNDGCYMKKTLIPEPDDGSGRV